VVNDFERALLTDAAGALYTLSVEGAALSVEGAIFSVHRPSGEVLYYACLAVFGGPRMRGRPSLSPPLRLFGLPLRGRLPA